MATSADKMFQGVRFWVAQRVPMRQYLIDTIKAGGGEIVTLERQADMLIADDIRKDVPPGSYSWRFIEDSAKEGIAQLKDKYAIGPDPTKSRPVASGYPKRGNRTEYTKEDDAILAKWVLNDKEDKPGGNTLYQKLEEKNPRHPWQSWQNRWRKKLQRYPRSQLEILASHAPVMPGEETPPPEEQAQAEASTPAQRQSEDRDPPSSPPQHRTTRRQTHSVQVQAPAPAPSSPIPSSIHSSPPMEQAMDDNVSEAGSNGSQDPNMEGFFDDLHDYMEVANPDINVEPIIGNRQFNLWQLAEAVGSQNIAIDNVDIDTVEWEQVADRLGYEDFDQPLLDQLLECWEDNLRDFLKYMEEFDKTRQNPEVKEEASVEGELELQNLQVIPNTREEEDEDDVQSDELSEHDSDEFIVNTGEEGDALVDPQLLSWVPPSPTTRKRSVDPSPQTQVTGYSKRRRLAPDAVVPSTPEQLLAVPATAGSNSRSGGSKPQPSPSLVRSQRLTRQRRLQLNDIIKDSQDDTQDRLHSPPQATRAQSPDLGSFVTLTPVARHVESAPHVTSPQQRRSATGHHILRSAENPVSTGAPDLGTDDEAEEDAPRSIQQSLSPQGAAPTLPVAKKRGLPSSFRNSSAPSAPSQTPADNEAPPRQHSVTQTPRPTQPHKAPNPTKDPRDMTLSDWVEHYVSQGYTRPMVKQALLATTMNPGTLVTIVLESLTKDGSIPERHSGIWTDRDDKDIQLLIEAGDDLDRVPVDYEEQDLLSRADRAEKRLLTKHGEVWTEQRKQYILEQAKHEAKKKMREARRAAAALRRNNGSETSM